MALPARIARGHHTAADPLDLARSDINGMLRLFGRGLFGDDMDAGALASLANYGVDIREDANHVYVIADLPGFRKEDVDISIEDGTLTITAERREEVAVPPGSQQNRAGQQGQGQQGQASQQQQQPGTASAQQGQQEEGQGEYLLRERRIQRFVRSFTLPPNVDDRHVQARLENGVLTVTLNKREESKPRHVQVS
jgi:HSP20 family protein